MSGIRQYMSTDSEPVSQSRGQRTTQPQESKTAWLTNIHEKLGLKHHLAAGIPLW